MENSMGHETNVIDRVRNLHVVQLVLVLGIGASFLLIDRLNSTSIPVGETENVGVSVFFIIALLLIFLRLALQKDIISYFRVWVIVILDVFFLGIIVISFIILMTLGTNGIIMLFGLPLHLLIIYIGLRFQVTSIFFDPTGTPMSVQKSLYISLSFWMVFLFAQMFYVTAYLASFISHLLLFIIYLIFVYIYQLLMIPENDIYLLLAYIKNDKSFFIINLARISSRSFSFWKVFIDMLIKMELINGVIERGSLKPINHTYINRLENISEIQKEFYLFIEMLDSEE